MNIKNLIMKITVKLNIDHYRRARIWRKFGVNMGENCRIAKGVDFGSEPYLVTMGNNSGASSDVQFITHDGGVCVLRELYKNNELEVFKPIKIGNNVMIGSSSIIMPGVEIGDNVVVGAGSIVTKNIPSNCIVAGVPARHIKTIEEYYQSALEKSVNTKHLNRKEKEDFLKKKFNIK